MHYKVIIRYFDEGHKEEIKEEGIWTTKVEQDSYRLDNIPFFARSLALGDIVLTERINSTLYATEIQTPSGNSTIRMTFDDNDILNSVRNDLADMKCSSEYNDIHQMIAVNIPNDVDYFGVIKPYLDKGLRAGLWDYEEACLAHSINSGQNLR